MISYTKGRNLYGVWTKSTDANNLLQGDLIANNDYRHICAMRDWPFLERTRTVLTTAATSFTTLPYDCDQVREISVIPVGSTLRYTPRQARDEAFWDDLNLVTFNADIPEWYFVFNGQVGLWPRPSSTGNTIYVTQKCRVIDLAIADITNTTVTTATNGSPTVVVSGGLTALHAGMFLQITYNPGTTNTGDGQWYEIAGVSGTTVTLVRSYGGTSIVTGSAACTIGQMPLLPEAFHDLPWQWAAGDYWSKEADARAGSFMQIHGSPAQGNQPATGKIKDLIAAYASETTNLVIDYGDEHEEINPNLTINL